MDISIFLAKVLGLYLFIMAIVMFVNVQRLRAISNAVAGTPFIFASGAFALIVGLLLVVSHNIWEADWKVIITIIGWLVLIKGIVRLLFPEYASRMMVNFVQNTTAYYITDVIILILGIYLSYVGFMS